MINVIDESLLTNFIIDVYHRIIVHHSMWHQEVEKELGKQKAFSALEYAWARTSKNMLQRLGSLTDFSNGKAVLQLTHDKKETLLNELAKCWLAQDGVWFQAVEFTEGMTVAKKCNDATWEHFSPFEAWSVKRLIGLEDNSGLTGLQRALDFRTYSRLNEQKSYFESDALIFQMKNCRVQAARMRKGLADYPCKSAGVVEYSYFAKEIDCNIRTECIGCPPDKHPQEWFCAWKFFR